MSSASHARVSSRSERRTANDNGSSRAPSGQQSRTERGGDPRRPPSPQASAAGTTHKRAASGSQRARGSVEERRTERVNVTTRETVTRTRSPERRPGPPAQPQERTRPSEHGRTQSGDPRPRSTKPETPTCTALMGRLSCIFLNFDSTMESRSYSCPSHKCTSGQSSIHTSHCFSCAAVFTTEAFARINFGSPRSRHFGGPAVRFHGV